MLKETPSRKPRASEINRERVLSASHSISTQKTLCVYSENSRALKHTWFCPAVTAPTADMSTTAGCLDESENRRDSVAIAGPGHPVPTLPLGEPGLQGRFSLAHGNKPIHSATSVQGDWLYQDDSPSVCISRENCLRHSLKSQEEGNGII